MDDKANGLGGGERRERASKSLTAAARRAARAGLERATKDRSATSFAGADLARKEPAEPPRRQQTTFGFAAAGACAKDAMRGAAGRRGVADPRLLTRWSEIVGDRLGALCRPVRIKHRAGMALGGVLILAVDRAHASEVEHELEAIRERVNAFFGHCAAAEIKITQSVEVVGAAFAPTMGRLDGDAALEGAPDSAEAPVLETPVLEALPERKRRELDALTAPVADDALRDALARLGANVMAETAAKRSRNRDPDAT